MTKRKEVIESIRAIIPDQIYRVTLSPAIFGLGSQATRDKIRTGELPLPAPLSPSSRFEAWTGQQILDHRAAMRKQAEEKAKTLRERPPQKQPPLKIKKMKLRKPARAES
jgi:hypothetical protein